MTAKDFPIWDSLLLTLQPLRYPIRSIGSDSSSMRMGVAKG
ncbi:hypothetical protein DM39_1459 [Burkholderia cenocepacia]|uniref:Uncharacterized protein n=1 Tax=Burkholderia cenocepacia TaxID=95486 RepID=A0AAN0RR48_9BURK|nr:hypothetical protein DM39_1459 [Burkholderia cenocepacia]